jgi:hypothetical protein
MTTRANNSTSSQKISRQRRLRDQPKIDKIICYDDLPMETTENVITRHSVETREKILEKGDREEWTLLLVKNEIERLYLGGIS